MVTAGQWVHYTLGEGDAAVINQRRKEALHNGSMLSGNGYQVHAGNHAEAGQTFPAVVVRVFDPASGTVNLRVSLDGTDDLWATSRREGGRSGEPGTWSWPERV